MCLNTRQVSTSRGCALFRTDCTSSIKLSIFSWKLAYERSFLTLDGVSTEAGGCNSQRARHTSSSWLPALSDNKISWHLSRYDAGDIQTSLNLKTVSNLCRDPLYSTCPEKNVSLTFQTCRETFNKYWIYLKKELK